MEYEYNLGDMGMKFSTGLQDGYVPTYNFERMARGLHVALPAKVISFDGNASVDIQPMGFQIGADDTRHKYPVIEKVPIATFRAGGFVITFPIKADDEGLAVFCDKNIDFLKNASFVNENYHYHELTDAFFIPGCVYTLKPVQAWDLDKVVIRNEKNSARITIAENGDIELSTQNKILFNAIDDIEIKSTGKILMSGTNVDLSDDLKIKSGDVSVSGDISASGNVSASGDVKAGSTSLSSHVHTSASPGSPTSPPTS